jgi:hypothetical protein
LDAQEVREREPTGYNLSVSAKHCRIDENKTLSMSEFAQHHVYKSDCNFMKMHLLNHFSDHIRQVGNHLYAITELLGRVIINLKQVYRQSNCHQDTFQTLQAKARKEAFPHRELNINTAKQHHDNEKASNINTYQTNVKKQVTRNQDP